MATENTFKIFSLRVPLWFSPWLKIRVSAVRFSPRPPEFMRLRTSTGSGGVSTIAADFLQSLGQEGELRCPHCSVEIHPLFTFNWLFDERPLGKEYGVPTKWAVNFMDCPSCEEAILYLLKDPVGLDGGWMIYPKAATRPPAPPEVPRALAEDFNEACLIVGDSPKASAALSRRCLQQLLRMQGHAQHDLAKAIDSILASKSLPSALARNLDAVRNIGNFAAHPVKDSNSGVIVAVEPEEAEWNLDVLERMLDFFYVQPAHDSARVAALNAKLIAAGKPPMKQ